MLELTSVRPHKILNGLGHKVGNILAHARPRAVWNARVISGARAENSSRARNARCAVHNNGPNYNKNTQKEISGKSTSVLCFLF